MDLAKQYIGCIQIYTIFSGQSKFWHNIFSLFAIMSEAYIFEELIHYAMFDKESS